MKRIITDVVTPSVFYVRQGDAGKAEIVCLIGDKQTLIRLTRPQFLHLTSDLTNLTIKIALFETSKREASGAEA